ncbi:MAG: ribonuclease P protein component [Burkholderiales bacterium]|nr:MAG: ribonuclease P protein component [Burkholderiales bacterium]
MQRLKTQAQFQAVMAGSTVSRTAHFALHRLALDAPATPVSPLFSVREPWVGTLVPKRWAKRAVTRNAIKRQIHAVSLAFEPQLPVAAHVVRLRSGFDRKQFISATSPLLKAAVRAELQQLFAGARP